MVLKGPRSGVEQKFFELCSRVVAEQGLELYDMDYIQGSSTLRVFISNPETQTAQIEECAQIDRALSPYIESEEWVPATLTLEVSSPGLFRNLSEKKHFETAQGEMIQLTLKKKLDLDELPKKLKNQKKFLGTLKNLDDEGVELSFEDGMTIKFLFNDIAKANLETQI